VQQPNADSDFFSKWHYALWKAINFGHEMHGSPTDKKTMKAFQRQCHRGFDHAQKLLLELVMENRLNNSITPKEQKYRELLIRKVADSIAYSICGMSPSGLAPWCTQQTPIHIDLQELEFTSKCACKLNSDSKDQFCLIADLTSCIHACDILRIDFREGAQRISTMEVKTGPKNDELYKSLMDGVGKRVCQHYLVEKHTVKDLKQMRRMLSQITTNYKCTTKFLRNLQKIPNEMSWYPAYSSRSFAPGISKAIASAMELGAAGVLVDGCLLIGLGYSKDPVEAAANANLIYDGFEKRLDGESEVRRFSPIKDNLDAMVCVPFCVWNLSLDERVLLARREVVMKCGLIGDRFLKLLKENNCSFEFATRKETALYKQQNPGKSPWEWDHRAIKLGNLIVGGHLIQPLSTDLVHPAAMAEIICAKLNESDMDDIESASPNASIVINFEYL